MATQRVPVDPATEARLFKFHGFFITVQIWKGQCRQEEYRKEDGSSFSETEIETLLKANREDSFWKPGQTTETRHVWNRNDAGAVAVYDLLTRTLTVTSAEFEIEATRAHDAAVEKQKTEEKKRLEGF